MNCPLCGFPIDCTDNNTERCKSCPFKSKSCKITRCPNCGYAFPGELGFITKIKEFFKRKKR